MSVTLLVLVVIALIAAAGVLYQAIGAVRDARRFAPPGRLVDVDGHRLHVVGAGSGRPAVVFEAGIGMSSLSWTEVLPEVSKITAAYAYDRAGLGWSESARTPRTLGNIVDELHALVTRVPVPAPRILVGHSFGAPVACAYATAHPEEVAGLVLIDPPTAAEWHRPTGERARMLWGGIQLSRMGAVLARVGVVRLCLALLTGGAPGVPRNFVRIFGPTAAATLSRIVGEVQKLPPEAYPMVQAHWCNPKCFHALAGYLGALEEAMDFLVGMPALAVPLVLISSGDQPPEYLAEHRALAARSPGGRHVVAAQTDHWVQYDQPKFVAGIVREMVDQIRAGESAADGPARRRTEA